MDIKKAKGIAGDFCRVHMKSCYTNAIKTILDYVKKLEDKVIELEETKEK